jgi:SAM-dependent methyltransferase
LSEPTPQEDVDPDAWADPSETYDAVAARYADAFVHELDGKPFDRELLARFAGTGRVGSGATGLVCDLGCGPGHVGAFLAQRGVDIVGIDRSWGMVTQARLHSPSRAVCQGDMSALGLLDGSLHGIVCFYALIHIPRAKVPAVLGELRRVLKVGGALLLAVHGGEGSLHATEMLEQSANLDATLFSLPELVGLLEAARFDLVEQHDRDPYAHEVSTRRLYVWVVRPA